MKQKLSKIIFFLFILFIQLPVEAKEEKSAENIKNKLSKIVSAEKYQYEEPKTTKKKQTAPENSFLVQLIKKIAAFFLSLFSNKYFIFIVILTGIFLIIFLAVFLTKNLNFISIKQQKNTKTIPVKINQKKKVEDYELEFEKAVKLLEKNNIKEAVSTLMLSLWLFFHQKQILGYHKNITNREYLKKLYTQNNIENIRTIVLKSEKIVYAGVSINERDPESVFQLVEKIIFK